MGLKNYSKKTTHCKQPSKENHGYINSVEYQVSFFNRTLVAGAIKKQHHEQLTCSKSDLPPLKSLKRIYG